VLVVGVRSFFLMLSDAFNSVWALAVDIYEETLGGVPIGLSKEP